MEDRTDNAQGVQADSAQPVNEALIRTRIYRVDSSGEVDGALLEQDGLLNLGKARTLFGEQIMVEHQYTCTKLRFYDQYWPGKLVPRVLYRWKGSWELKEVPRA